MTLAAAFPNCQIENDYNPKVDGAFEIKYIDEEEGKEVLVHSKAKGDGSVNGDKLERIKLKIKELLGE